MVTKGHTQLYKPVGKSSKSPQKEVFLREFLNKIEDIDAFTFPEEILLMHSHFLKKMHSHY